MTGCDCDPREATLDANLNVVCAECGALLADYDSGHDSHGGYFEVTPDGR